MVERELIPQPPPRRARAIFRSLLVAALAVAPAASFEATHAALPNFVEVSPGIFRSGQPTPEGLRAVRKRGVRTVIVLREEMPEDERQEAARLGLQLVHVPMDGTHMPSIEEVDKALDVIRDSSKQPVLVHCRHGEDRTGAVIAAYRVVVNGWDPAAAEREARELRFNLGNLKEFLVRFQEHERRR